MDYGKLLAGCRDSFKSNKTRNVEFRMLQIKQLKKMYEENIALFEDALKQDLQKPKYESLLYEIQFLLNDLDMLIGNLKSWVKPLAVPGNHLTITDYCYTTYDPYGVVLVIGTWNYPLQLTMLPAHGAIAAGNCVILKPSEVAPATAKVIAELIPRYIDNECYKVVCSGVQGTQELLKQKFDYIFYTGSARVGQIIYEAASKTLTPVTLELGGKSPCYVDNTVDFYLSAKRILWGKCMNLGQTCIAPDYILCDSEVQEKLITNFKRVIKEWYGEFPVKSPDMSRLINKGRFMTLKNMVESTHGKIAVGGYMEESSLFIEPTVLVDVQDDDPVMNEEIFGPILPIINVDSLDSAINYINSRPKALSIYVFSAKTSVQKQLINQTYSGTMCLNDTVIHMSLESLPFGGVGESGFGSYHGKYSYETFSHKKSVFIRSFNSIGEALGSIRYPPYTDRKIQFAKRMFKRRVMPSCRITAYLCCFLVGVGVALLFQYILNKSHQR